jgi:hypothetical protein
VRYRRNDYSRERHHVERRIKAAKFPPLKTAAVASGPAMLLRQADAFLFRR